MMKMHRSEEIWLILSFGMIIGFMVITGYQTFALGMGPPSHMETIDPQKVDETAPFDQPGVYQTGENEYEVVMTLEIFNFNPGNINNGSFWIDFLLVAHFLQPSKLS